MLRITHLLLIALSLVLAGCGSGSEPGGKSAASNNKDGGLGSLVGGDNSEDESADDSSEATSLKTGDVVTNSIGMKLGVVPPGEFRMGSPPTEEKRSGDESQHTAKLTNPVLMGVHEVTQAEFHKVMESNPSGITDSDQLPVQNVSWEQAVAFCRKLSELPEEKSAGRVYRLPTEAEWEHACRSGSTTATAFGNAITSIQANFDGNYPYGTTTEGTFVGKPQAVGSYEPNAWGLYDMHGNVWEWCHDWYGADFYSETAGDDPQGPESGISHVIRGGSWYNFGYVVRSAYRSEFTPPLEANIYGMRVVAAFSPDDTFVPSELDSPNPTPMSPTPTPAPVAAATPATRPPAAGSTPPAVAIADSSMMMPSISDSVAESDSSKSVAATSASDDDIDESGQRESTNSIATSRRNESGRYFLFPLAMLALAGLVDPQRWSMSRHLDLLPILLATLAGVIPYPDFRIGILWMIAAVLVGRLLSGLKSTTLPKPVVPGLKERTLLLIVAGAFVTRALIDWGTMAHSTFLMTIIGTVNHAAIAYAVVLIGERWKKRSLGLTLTALWLVMPVGPAPIAASCLLWAFVFLNRAPLAGTLLGCAIGMNWWLLFVAPLWLSFYRGKGRIRFAVTTAMLGVSVAIAITLTSTLFTDATLAATSVTGSLFGAAVSMLFRMATITLLTVAAGVAYVRPKARSESVVALLTTTLLLGVFLSTGNAGMSALAFPWVILTLVGGSGSHSSLQVTQGRVIPLLHRLTSSIDKRSEPKSA